MEMKINMKHLAVLIAFGVLVGAVMLAFADDIDFGTFVDLIEDIAKGVHSLLIPISFLLIIAAAVIYAAGQLGSAEMRSKSQSWAIWALVGALIAFAISTLGPVIIKSMYGTTTTPWD